MTEDNVAGICMRRKDAYDRDALHFAPFVLLPSPFPRSTRPLPALAVNQPPPPFASTLDTASTFPFQDILRFPFDLSLALHQPRI